MYAFNAKISLPFMLCILKCYCRNWFYSCMLSKFCEVNLSLSAWCSNWLVKYACKLCHIWKQMGIFFQTNRNIYIYKIWKILKTLFWNFDFISAFFQIRSVEFLFVNWYVKYLQHFFICTFLCKYFKMAIKYFLIKGEKFCCIVYYDIKLANTFHFIEKTFFLEKCK